MLAKFYSEFYPVEGRQPSQMAVAASVVRIDPNLVSAAGTMGSTVTVTGIDNDAATRLGQDADVQRLIGMFQGHGRELHCHHRDQQILMVGILLLTLGKQVTSEGFQGGMENSTVLQRFPRNTRGILCLDKSTVL
jgi:hypothetical protein